MRDVHGRERHGLDLGHDAAVFHRLWLLHVGNDCGQHRDHPGQALREFILQGDGRSA